MALRQNIKPVPAETRLQPKYQHATHPKTQAAGTVDGFKRGILRVGSWGRLLSKGRRALAGLHKPIKDSPSTQTTQLDQTSLSEPYVHVSRSDCVSEDRKDTEYRYGPGSRYELVTRKDKEDIHTEAEEKVQRGQTEAYQDKNKLAYQLRQISTHRARVYHEKLGVQEQSRFLSYKRGEATKAVGILEQDLTQHPPGSSKFDAARLTQLVHNLQHAFRELADVELELDYQNEKLTEQERLLKDVEDDLYQDLTGAELFSGVDILGGILDQISSPTISPRIRPSAYDEIGDENDIEQHIALHDSCSSQMGSIVASVHRRNLTSSEYQPDNLHRQFDTAESSDLVSPYGPTLDYPDDFETSSIVSSDVDTCCAGLQFSNKGELGNLQDELGITNEDVLIRQKREDDLGSLLAVDLNTDSIPPEPYQDKMVSPYNLAQKISKWILSVNLQSWLEFSYLVWFSDLERFVSTMGYTKLGTFIRRNYSCEANITEPTGDGSIRPSVSSVSNDIPLRMQQIFIHDSDGAVEEFEIYRPMQEQDQQNAFAVMSTKAETGHSTQLRNNHSVSSSSTGRTQIFDRPLRSGTSRTDLSHAFITQRCDQ